MIAENPFRFSALKSQNSPTFYFGKGGFSASAFVRSIPDNALTRQSSAYLSVFILTYFIRIVKGFLKKNKN